MLLDINHTGNAVGEFLFNQYFYLKAEGKTPLQFVDNEFESSQCLVCIETNTNQYVSGYHAPFAGFESKEIGNSLETFLNETLMHLKNRNARTLEIKQAPFFYQHLKSNEIHRALLKAGFVVAATECNQYISVEPHVEFERLIDAQKRRRLKNAKKMGMNVQLLDHIESINWYNVYADGRTDKGYPITITEEKYTGLSKLGPNIYTYAGVYLKDILIATAIFVRVSKDVMYYFVAASSPAYAHLSPTVLLIEAMYNKAVNEKCQFLDLGISSVYGQLNAGLHAFKKHMGAQECSKITYLYMF